MLQQQFSHLNGRKLDNRHDQASYILTNSTIGITGYHGAAPAAQKTFLPLLRVLLLPGKQRAHRAVP
jgi:hypothetical protein